MSEQTQSPQDDATQQYIAAMQQQVQIAEAGYVAFRRIYAQTNRTPPRKTYVNRNYYARLAIGGVMIAASVVSASHTIPVFAGDMDGTWVEGIIHLFVGIAAFVMGEMALASYAYTGVMRHFRDTGEEPASLKALLRWGVGVPVVIMVAANVSHQFQTSGEYIDPRIMSGIRLAIALAAPLMAYISGEVFATFEVGDRIDEAKLEKENADAESAWEDRCRAAWDRNKHLYGGKIRVEPVPVPQISVSAPVSAVRGADGQRTDNHGYGTGYTKRMDARDMIRTHLQENPDDLSMTVRELADKLGRSKTTVAEVMKEMRGG